MFVSRQKIKSLNKKYLHRQYATDVLAFDLRSGVEAKQKRLLNGEIIISLDAAKQNHKTFQTSLAQEIVLYVIHGILHLLGYDDHSPADIKRMRRKERELLEYLKKEIEKL